MLALQLGVAFDVDAFSLVRDSAVRVAYAH